MTDMNANDAAAAAGLSAGEVTVAEYYTGKWVMTLGVKITYEGKIVRAVEPSYNSQADYIVFFVNGERIPAEASDRFTVEKIALEATAADTRAVSIDAATFIREGYTKKIKRHDCEVRYGGCKVDSIERVRTTWGTIEFQVGSWVTSKSVDYVIVPECELQVTWLDTAAPASNGGGDADNFVPNKKFSDMTPEELEQWHKDEYFTWHGHTVDELADAVEGKTRGNAPYNVEQSAINLTNSVVIRIAAILEESGQNVDLSIRVHNAIRTAIEQVEEREQLKLAAANSALEAERQRVAVCEAALKPFAVAYEGYFAHCKNAKYDGDLRDYYRDIYYSGDLENMSVMALAALKQAAALDGEKA